MELTLTNAGGLIPLWILGAPFLMGLYELFTTPRPAGSTATRSTHPGPWQQPHPPQAPQATPQGTPR